MRCPKCNAQSQNEQICDVCGAVFSKIRAREIEGDAVSAPFSAGEVSGAHGFNSQTGGLSYTKILLILLAIGLVGGYIYSRSGGGGGVQLAQLMEVATLSEEAEAPKQEGSIMFSTPLPAESSSVKATLVDFWAPWCGPCKMYAPVLDQVTAEYGKDLKVVKLNLDENSNAAQRAKVTAVPTLLLFDATGKLSERFVGGPPPDELRAAITAAIK